MKLMEILQKHNLYLALHLVAKLIIDIIIIFLYYKHLFIFIYHIYIMIKSNTFEHLYQVYFKIIKIYIFIYIFLYLLTKNLINK